MARRNQAQQRRLVSAASGRDVDFANPNRQETVQGEIDHQHDQLTRLRQIRRLANALGVAAQIPEGDHLVLILGEGSERCNREALITWVIRQFPQVEHLRPSE